MIKRQQRSLCIHLGRWFQITFTYSDALSIETLHLAPNNLCTCIQAFKTDKCQWTRKHPTTTWKEKTHQVALAHAASASKSLWTRKRYEAVIRYRTAILTAGRIGIWRVPCRKAFEFSSSISPSLSWLPTTCFCLPPR